MVFPAAFFKRFMKRIRLLVAFGTKLITAETSFSSRSLGGAVSESVEVDNIAARGTLQAFVVFGSLQVVGAAPHLGAHAEILQVVDGKDTGHLLVVSSTVTRKPSSSTAKHAMS